MAFITGNTIYETIVSVDSNNDPVSGATFSIVLFNNGQIYTSTTVSTALVSAVDALFTFTYTPTEEGHYQVYAKNSLTDVIWVSDVKVVLDEEPSSGPIYIGI